jgi:thiamine-phosphate pyrophosphorylase
MIDSDMDSMTWWNQKLRGFYSVLDRDDPALALALLSSSRVMQVRKKPASRSEIEAIGATARRLTAQVGATLIVNDDIALAHWLGADGVHLGQRDLDLETARSRTDLLIGVSTHDLDQLRAAVNGGADYVAYGPIFPTKTKDHPEPVVGLDGLRAAIEVAGDTPVVAIGGLGGEHARDVASAGAAAMCSISWVNNSSDPRGRAREIAEAWGVVRLT